jgi:hypothetical protein
MCKNKLEPAESLSQRQGVLIKEIIALSLEFGVILLLEDEYNVSGDSIRLQARKHSIILKPNHQKHVHVTMLIIQQTIPLHQLHQGK